jgi:two-component system chemotaxis sensor kinase CheA
MNMNGDESMLEVYIYETQQLLEALENTLFEGESGKKLNPDQINEVFRIMHTIKGASAMMEFENMTKLSHSLEDMFSQIRDCGAPTQEWPGIFDLVFSAISFFNGELAKLLAKAPMDGDAAELIELLKARLGQLKGDASGCGAQAPGAVHEQGGSAQKTAMPAAVLEHKTDEPCYKVKVLFEENCQMESIRAFGVVQSLKKICTSMVTVPEDINVDSATEEIRNNGFCLFIRTNENPDKIKEIMDGTLFVKSYSVLPFESDEEATAGAADRTSAPDAGEHLA